MLQLVAVQLILYSIRTDHFLKFIIYISIFNLNLQCQIHVDDQKVHFP